MSGNAEGSPLVGHPPVAPVDDLPHSASDEPDFSESYYFQFAQEGAVEGFVRLAHRPGERSGERTVCLFLPGGRSLVSFARPVFEDPNVFRAAGLSVEIVDPLRLLRVRFQGPGYVLDAPGRMSDPSTALSGAMQTTVELQLDFSAIAPAQHFSLDDQGDFTPHHFDQFMRATGRVVLGTPGEPKHTRIDVQGFGMRDHGWGRRSWGVPRFYRWLYGNDAEVGFAVGVLATDRGQRAGGFLWDGSEIHALDQVQIRTVWRSDEEVAAIDAEGIVEGRHWSISGIASPGLPLRHRRSGSSESRLLFSPVRWRAGARILTGQAEHVDRREDGCLLGVVEYDAGGTARTS